ncbi:MAG TPA: hypothetical protein VLG40_01935 [Candidatus Saccharimonas sp.]|nr:hypothetical protein [Candidatus Saccharimonas sp.]
MTAKHHIIYIPGLGDKRVNKLGQKLLIRLWRHRFRVSAECFIVGWADQKSTLQSKLDQVHQKIIEAKQRGYIVSLVASSAGGSLAINALARHHNDIHRTAIICGALASADKVAPEVYKLNPMFKESMVALPASFKKLTPHMRHNILSVKPLHDSIVNPKYQSIKDAPVLQMPTSGHIYSIVIALTRYSRAIVDFVCDESRQ